MEEIFHVDTTLLQVIPQLGEDKIFLKDLDNIESRYDTSLLDPVHQATPTSDSQQTHSPQIPTAQKEKHKKPKRAPDIFASREFAAYV